MSTYHDQQSIIAKLSCKVPTQYFYLVLTYSSFFPSPVSYITGWICWTASMGFWQMLDRQWRICHGCSCVIGRKEQLKMLLLAVLNFTALLIEYSFSRHLYSSIEVGGLSLYSLFFTRILPVQNSQIVISF